VSGARAEQRQARLDCLDVHCDERAPIGSLQDEVVVHDGLAARVQDVGSHLAIAELLGDPRRLRRAALEPA
jgi:hypothetical protein